MQPHSGGHHHHYSQGHHERKWRTFKLLVDPLLKKGHQKLYRYDGVVPGALNADLNATEPKDPRSRLSRLLNRRELPDLPVPKFKVDKYFVGELPPKQITFTNLNDNVREQFLRSMCERYGDLESIRIYHHPKTKKHLGLASVTYTKTRYAKEAAMGLNRTSVMGRIIIVQVDAGGIRGFITPNTPSDGMHTPHVNNRFANMNMQPEFNIPQGMPPQYQSHPATLSDFMQPDGGRPPYRRPYHERPGPGPGEQPRGGRFRTEEKEKNRRKRKNQKEKKQRERTLTAGSQLGDLILPQVGKNEHSRPEPKRPEVDRRMSIASDLSEPLEGPQDEDDEFRRSLDSRIEALLEQSHTPIEFGVKDLKSPERRNSTIEEQSRLKAAGENLPSAVQHSSKGFSDKSSRHSESSHKHSSSHHHRHSRKASPALGDLSPENIGDSPLDASDDIRKGNSPRLEQSLSSTPVKDEGSDRLSTSKKTIYLLRYSAVKLQGFDEEEGGQQPMDQGTDEEDRMSMSSLSDDGDDGAKLQVHAPPPLGMTSQLPLPGEPPQPPGENVMNPTMSPWMRNQNNMPGGSHGMGPNQMLNEMMNSGPMFPNFGPWMNNPNFHPMFPNCMPNPGDFPPNFHGPMGPFDGPPNNFNGDFPPFGPHPGDREGCLFPQGGSRGSSFFPQGWVLG
ncbi:putative histone-lysine N-methyltransferase SETD1B-A [Apostichopus japonicus]|uniref:Putative histone-lysine N-methyltransferase SETD1B-A n=1 Tax=Stichopus japonicus TaxID=307972 RepID=A0A2G8JT12_STIJA|nr:putative histone-lysine N-methyltransferase SETD1B-A [Apostichopus japonicus]